MCSMFLLAATDWRSVRIYFLFASQTTVQRSAAFLLLNLRDTYCFWPMQHTNAEIPQKKPTVFTYTAEPIVPIIASPRIEAYSGDPRLVTLASGNYCCFCNGPYRDQIILAASEHVFAIWRPAYAEKSTVVARK